MALSKKFNPSVAEIATDSELEYYTLRCSGMSNQEIADHAGKSKSAVGGALKRLERRFQKQDAKQTEDSNNECESGSGGLKTTLGKESGQIIANGTDIKTLKDALSYADVDLGIWEVEKYTINKWDTSMREPATTVGGRGDDAYAVENDEGGKHTLWTRGSHKPVKVTNYQVKVWLRRKITETEEQIFDRVMSRMEGHAPDYKKIKREPVVDPHLAEMVLCDAHFAKLAYSKETFEDYDLQITRELYKNACIDLLDRINGYNIERILFPIGHDLFHVDDDTRKTPKGGNELDVDGRIERIYDMAHESVVNAIDMCRQVAPVDVIYVPGNHDPRLGMYLAKTIGAWYRNCEDVFVNPSIISRKYYRYGTLLLGMTHKARIRGGGLNPERLTVMMATEAKQDFAETKWHEWHLGDQHRKLGCSFMDNNEELGTRVRWLPSLTAQDRWHFDEGYVLQRRAVECYLWNKDSGYVGHFSVNARGEGGLALESSHKAKDGLR